MVAGSIQRLLICGSLAAAGCSAYDSRYVFGPGPVDVPAARPGSEEGPVQVLVTVPGVRRADKKAGTPACVEVRLRLDNTSPAAATFDPRSLSLFSADLEQFPDPRVTPADSVQLPPGGHALVEACFPFPAGRSPGQMNLDGLNVRWEVAFDGQPVLSSATFVRQPNGYYDRYPYRIGVGYQGYP
jgi:hypothetical protein